MRHYTIRQTSELLGIKVRTVREWIHNGKLKAVKYPDSKMWHIPESEIMRFIGRSNDNDNES